jgi:kinesin family member 23
MNLRKALSNHFFFQIPFQGVPVANIRHRRSRSAGERWLEHRAPNPVPLGTIFQPYYKSGRKSITKCELKDVVNNKASKYCLVSQQADTDGEVETMLYKVSGFLERRGEFFLFLLM